MFRTDDFVADLHRLKGCEQLFAQVCRPAVGSQLGDKPTLEFDTSLTFPHRLPRHFPLRFGCYNDTLPINYR